MTPTRIFSRTFKRNHFLLPTSRPTVTHSRPQSLIRRTEARRYASTESSTGSTILNFGIGATLLLGFGLIFVYVTDTRASAHRYIVIPALRLVYRDPEEAHHAGNSILKRMWDLGLHPRERHDPDAEGDLSVEVFGHTLRNPIATSAGIDKHCDIPDALFEIGPAIIEIGGATPMPQDGNHKPRVFRLSSQNALINRYGLNSEGADYIAMRLRHRVRSFADALGFGHDAVAEQKVLNGEAGVPPGSLHDGKLLAVNIAKNKTTPQDDIKAVTEDYIYCVERLAPYADILVVNVSSPNTPGLRNLQQGDSLRQILTGVVNAAKSIDRKTKPAIMVKVSPDEDSDEQVGSICDAVWASGVDGVVVGNTTNRRPDALPHLHNLTPLEEQTLLETGGFSGPHLYERTVALVKKYRRLLNTPPNTSPAPSNATIEALKAEAEQIKSTIGVGPGLASGKSADTDEVTTSVHTGVVPARNISDKPDSEKQPLINLPTERFYDKSKEEQDSISEPVPKASNKDSTHDTEREERLRTRLQSIQQALDQIPPHHEHLALEDHAKIIFATGGITNGKQALEVLNAGASVAMVYTALVYGGIGTISRIKDEMRQEINDARNENWSKIEARDRARAKKELSVLRAEKLRA